MTPKERVLTAINHKEPDKIPKTADFSPEFAYKLRRYLNLKNIPFKGVDIELAIELGNDMLFTYQGFLNSYYKNFEEDYIDDWGIGWKIIKYNTKFGEGRYMEIDTHPLYDDDAIKTYDSPDPLNNNLYEDSKKLINYYGDEYAIVGDVACTIFETAWALRGLDKLMIDFLINEDLANKILDIPYNYHSYAAKKLVELGVDIIWTGDDMGGQKNMLISPELWRKYLKPRMATLYSELKKINPEIKIVYHSDGCIYPIIEELIEIGVDILNPIQPKSMDPYYLKKRYGNKISFLGTFDIQEKLPFGTKNEIEYEVRNRIKNMAPGGGFIIAPAHSVQIDTPIENFFIFWNYINRYGTYPIRV